MQYLLDAIEYYQFDWKLYIFSVVLAMFIGMSKTGVSGASMIPVPLFAALFGGKISAGLVLPMLSMADIFGVSYYHRHADWKHIFRLLPWAAVGIFIGIWFGDLISDQWFKYTIGIIVLLSMGIMIYRDTRSNTLAIPDKWWFSALLGTFGGFATMIGNAAGSIMALYLLSMHLPKNVYIGTAAWFFFIINLFKIPFHIFIWETITLNSFIFDLLMLPGIVVGAVLGVRIVKLFPEIAYRYFVIITTIVSALLLFK